MHISNIDLAVTTLNFGIQIIMSMLAPLTLLIWINLRTLSKTPFCKFDIMGWLQSKPKDYLILTINMILLGFLIYYYYDLVNKFVL